MTDQARLEKDSKMFQEWAVEENEVSREKAKNWIAQHEASWVACVIADAFTSDKRVCDHTGLGCFILDIYGLE